VAKYFKNNKEVIKFEKETYDELFKESEIADI